MENTTIIPKNRLLRISEAADMLAVSSSFIYILIQRGDIPAVKMGRALRLSERSVEDYISENTTISTGQRFGYNSD